MAIQFTNLKELLESLILVINLKRLLNVIKEWGTILICAKQSRAKGPPIDNTYVQVNNFLFT